MGNSAAARGRRIGHHCDCRTLEESRQPVFRHISGEFNVRISSTLVSHGIHVAGSLRMVASSDDEPGIWNSSRNNFERFQHQLQPLVGSPFSESQNAMFRISAAGEIRIFWPRRQDAMRTQMHIVAPIFFVKYFAISRHQHRNRV
jgi:hypothetical protein